MATTIKPQYDTIATMTISPASVASGSARVGASVSNGTNLYDDVLVFVQIKTGASGVSATGYINIRLASSIDGGTTFSGNVGGADATKTSFPNCPILWTMADANANAATCYAVFSLAAVFGSVPKDWTLLVDNESGAALDSTAGNHVVKYMGVWYQNV